MGDGEREGVSVGEFIDYAKPRCYSMVETKRCNLEAHPVGCVPTEFAGRNLQHELFESTRPGRIVRCPNPPPLIQLEGLRSRLRFARNNDFVFHRDDITLCTNTRKNVNYSMWKA